MTNQQRILNAMIKGFWYHVWDLSKIHYDAGRYLRRLREEGLVEGKDDGKYVKYRKPIKWV
jgi:hypothetical protein